MSNGKLTTDQAKGVERNDRYIAREGLISLMNATKWREAEDAILSIVGHWPWWRAETLRSGGEMEFDHDDLYFQAIPRKVIVHLDIDLARPVGHRPRVDYTEPVAAALKSAGVPFTREDGNLRIWGYARPGAFPTFTEYEKHQPPK